MADKKGQKKRCWADVEKGSICDQALAPGVPVAQVASRSSTNANLIFNWLKYPRFFSAADGAQMVLEGDSIFFPVELSGPSIDHLANDTIRYALGRMPKARPHRENDLRKLDNNICEQSLQPLESWQKKLPLHGLEGDAKGRRSPACSSKPPV